MLIGKSSPYGGRFPFLLSEWFFIICLCHISVNKMCIQDLQTHTLLNMCMHTQLNMHRSAYMHVTYTVYISIWLMDSSMVFPPFHIDFTTVLKSMLYTFLSWKNIYISFIGWKLTMLPQNGILFIY